MSPLLRLTLALVSLCGLVVLMADLMFGLFPDRERQLMDLRRPVAESLAGQVAVLLRHGQSPLVDEALAATVQRVPGAEAAVVRSSDGEVVAQQGRISHDAPPPDAKGTLSSRLLLVPLMADGQPWGRLELHFKDEGGLLRLLREPIVAMLLTVSVLGTLVFWLYLRRALQHLDPSAVIPERVQGAFDVMSEGVVVLDGKGRVLLANKAWRQLLPEGEPGAAGQLLSAQGWLAAALPDNSAEHPWMGTLGHGQPVSGLPLQVAGLTPADPPRHLLVNTMPVTDGDGAVRGCMVSFGDLSELHRAHAALQQTLTELAASKEQVQRQNEELHRMATRDPLTGSLNRRAFNEAFDALFNAARDCDEPLSCLILDIDHFKKVNDTYGHGIGDRVIEETARKLAESARACDLVCRYGGEEFVMALPGLDAQAALRVAERVRARMEAECGAAVREVPGLQVTISLGVATLGADVGHAAQMIELADQALYRAKRGGRNRALLAGSAATAKA